MLQNQRACQLVRSKTGCEPLALAVAWGARTAGRCAAGVLGAVKHQRFSDQQLETFAARAPGICLKPVCDAGEPCPLPPQDDAVDVSVIVPVHNGERFLRACLDSILHQNTTRRLQVLAVEDGSTDGSGAILAEYARQGGVTVLHSEQGGSAARARNTGLARAVGRWVLFVDGDDCLLPDAVETLLAAQARTGRISCRAAGSIATKPTPAVRCSSTQKRATPAPDGWMWWSCPALPGASCTAGPCLNGYGSPPGTPVLRMP